MPKQIIFCADGTWNGPGTAPAPSAARPADDDDLDTRAQQDAAIDDKVTNVVKLFRNLAGDVTDETRNLHDEAERALKPPGTGGLQQIAKYMHGVGDSKNPVIRVLGGGLGAGVIARIVRGYTFISRYYDPGDSIHIVGFSRGAYTARALAGMIAEVGLLNRKAYDPNDKTKAYLMGLEAWVKCKGVVFTGKNDLAARLSGWVNSIGSAITRLTLKDKEFITGVRVKSVGVWDTVGSMGIPDYVTGKGRRDLFTFVNLSLSPMIDHGFHAMALDERRLDFPVTRWNADPRVEQVWFVGAHSDVGGGYPAAESGLSDIALDWMMKKLAAVGVQFASPLLHDPDLTKFEQAFHTPWSKPPFNIKAQARKPLPGDVFDPSVRKRWTDTAVYQQQWPKLFS
jgi:uncharacterized protein (DUF2235 family)